VSKDSRGYIVTLIGPGILVAATGVGAGDLATGAFVAGWGKIGQFPFDVRPVDRLPGFLSGL